MAAPAALQPPGGGLPPQQLRSFAEALKSPIPSDEHHTSPAMPLPPDAHRMGSHKGSPAIYFTPSHIQTIVQPFNWTLIGKFTHGFNKQNPSLGRPPVEDLVNYFKALDLKNEVQLGLLDNRHVLIQIQHYDNFLRLYSQPVWNVKGHPMRIFKWTSSFYVDREAPFAPVWISFPRLPIHFFEKLTLMAIASLLGTPLRLDAPTIALKRPSIARVQVEIDLLKPRIEKIWIGVDQDEGFWQKIEYADVPDFCQHCNHVGHSDVQCHVRHPDLKVSALRKSSEQIRAGQDKHQLQKFIPTGRQADPSGFFAVADPSNSDAATVAPVIVPPQLQTTGVQTAGLSDPLRSVMAALPPEKGVLEVLVSDDDANLNITQALTDDTMKSNDSPVESAKIPVKIVEAPSSTVQTLMDQPAVQISSIDLASQQVPRLEALFVEAVNKPTDLSASLGLTPIEVSYPDAPSNVCSKVFDKSLANVNATVTSEVVPTHSTVALSVHALNEQSPSIGAETSVGNEHALVVYHPNVPTNEHVPATALNPYSPASHSPTPSEAYDFQHKSTSPLQPPIIQPQPSQQKMHTFLGHDMGYNDSDYYQDSLGADESGFEDDEASDVYTYEDITDGSEGAHSRKKKDRRKLKGSASNISATKEELNEQSRILGLRIRNQGRPPGSRNRTYFDVVRTMETRASKSISN